MSLFGPPNVEKLKTKGDVKGLIKALGYENKKDMNNQWEIRRHASEALVQIGDPAVKQLINTLKDSDLFVRRSAAKALGRIGNALAVDPLIAALKSDDAEVRRLAAEALGRIGSALAVDPLIAALKSDDAEVRRLAAEALGRIGSALAVDPLIAILKDNDVNVLESAAEALGRIGNTLAIDPLIATLKKKTNRIYFILMDAPTREKVGRSQVREKAAEALVKIGVTAIDPLIATLKDRDKDVRKLAAMALDKLNWKPNEDEDQIYYWIAKGEWDCCLPRGAQAVEPLITVLVDIEYGISEDAAKTLAKIGDVRAIMPLFEAVSNMPAYYSEPDNRWLLAVNLTYWWSEINIEAVGSLISACNSVLNKADKTPSKYNYEEFLNYWVIELLGKIGNDHAVKVLIVSLLGSQSYKKNAAEALGTIGNVRAVTPLLIELMDGIKNEQYEREKILEALGKLKWRPDGPEKDISIDQVVDLLVDIYQDCPEGIYSETPQERAVRKIGRVIHEIDGIRLMQVVHAQFSARHFQHARNLEMMWSGIGEWRG